MPIEEYLVGQPVRFVGRFWDDPEMTDPVDPATVKLWVRDPAGIDTEYEYPTNLDRDEEGVYSVIVVPDQEDAWNWRWEASEPEVVMQGVITVYARNAGS